MGNAAPPPMEADQLKGHLTLETIEFRKLWSGEGRYQMSKLVFKTSDDVSKNFYYHDLLGILHKPPLLTNQSIITSCNFTRKNGESHIFRGIWEGELKPGDTVRFTKGLTKEVTVHVKDKKDLGSYIKDETKCKELMNIKDSFLDGHRFTDSGDGELHLEVTLNKYSRSKGGTTQWAVYKLIIPQQVVRAAIRDAVVCAKPKIVENFIDIHKDEKETPTHAQKSITSPNSVAIESLDVNGNQTKRINDLEHEVKRLKKENLNLSEECKEYKLKLDEIQTKYNELLRNTGMSGKNYKTWDSDTITDWILSLEPQHGAFDAYKNTLRNKLREEAVNGSHLMSLTTTDLDRFGIKSFQHKQIILENVKKLVSESQDGRTAYANEGVHNSDNTSFCG
eukprot:259527_1